MNPQQLTQLYDEATGLAEAGRYEPAMARMFEYLRHRPLDGPALNDAGTILFCMGRGKDAIVCYEKAAEFCRGDQLSQVYWNLCEAYLQEEQPARAVGLFDRMQEMELLNVDILNRTADALLQQDMLGPAVELLLRSLRLNPDQKVLIPMLEVIRGHRARTTIVVHNKTTLAQSLADSLGRHLELTVLEDLSPLPPQIPSQTDIALFFGCGQSLVDASLQTSEMRRVVILDVQDILSPRIQTVNWQAVQTVIVCGGDELAGLFTEQIGSLPKTLTVIGAEPIPNPDNIPFGPRKKGKHIAAVGPWDARRNPMFALMCFQKLHYLDPDTCLHLAGEFVDASTERYVLQMIDALGLDTVVFVDGPVKNIKKWLRDKHYILSTSIDGSGLEDVWLAMACGLRPVIHTFPGAAERLDGRYLFILAEDFCEQILGGCYDAAEHRAAVERSFTQKGIEPIVLDQIFRFESEIPLANRRSGAVSALPIAPVEQPASVVDASAAGSQKMPTQTVRRIESEALQALAAAKKMRHTADRTEQQNDTARFTPSVSEPDAVQNDSFESGPVDGLSIDALIGEGCGSIPFPVER